MMIRKNSNFSKLFVFLVFFLPLSLKAQDFRLGFKAHPVFSNVDPRSDNHEVSKARVGLSYGLLFDYFIKDSYAISTEFAISSLGGQVEYKRSDTTITSSYKINYIEIPVTVKLLTTEVTEGLRVYGKFGLGLGFRIKSEAELEYKKGNAIYANDDIKNANEYVQPFALGLHLGTGIEYNLAENLDLQVGITYNSGFLNIMKSKSIYRQPTANPIKAMDANINYIALNVGLLF
jgi:hypothetical protein